MAEQEKPKVGKYNTPKIRQALEDHLLEYLTEELRWPEDHTWTNIRLLLGSIAVGLAVLSHYYPSPYPQIVPVLVFLVLTYVF